MGSIDEVRIYTRAITADEVKAIYEEEKNSSNNGNVQAKFVSCTLNDNFIIYPNPNNGNLQLKSVPEDVSSMRIINMAGRLIYNSTITFKQTQDPLDFSICQPGTYMCNY